MPSTRIKSRDREKDDELTLYSTIGIGINAIDKTPNVKLAETTPHEIISCEHISRILRINIW
ncbi:MAG: hypothetical protein ALECFALPRED_005747 [Alectoria fallacina]|uniref:Uncharacterized protein n=1 Tax=Alectoria fallacina TaxID=1903189 RepID=A0A8H3FWW7_9LECA|nr:MAG: hypothetical protein ALECFALPRED_005747 [Alectoria fallacina]